MFKNPNQDNSAHWIKVKQHIEGDLFCIDRVGYVCSHCGEENDKATDICPHCKSKIEYTHIGMSIEEAIQVLKYPHDMYSDEFCEALDIAVDVLTDKLKQERK